jgi:hypothetical protein
MDKTFRARLVIDHVLGLADRYEKSGSPRSDATDRPSRWISDDTRWKARISTEYQMGPDGERWDLFELFVYDELKMTAAMKGELIELRLFRPGKWEPIFTLVETSDTTPLLP